MAVMTAALDPHATTFSLTHLFDTHEPIEPEWADRAEMEAWRADTEPDLQRQLEEDDRALAWNAHGFEG